MQDSGHNSSLLKVLGGSQMFNKVPNILHCIQEPP